MKLKCQRCNREWEYSGEQKPNDKYPVYVSCPRCKTSIKLQKEDKKDAD